MKKSFTSRGWQFIAAQRTYVAFYIVLCSLLGKCLGQGTMTFTFEGQPSGTSQQRGFYTETGMRFGDVGPGTLYLSGGGVAGYPDNGTGYLYMPDGNLGGLKFEFSPNIRQFDLISFDAARYASAAPPTLQVIGYKFQIMGPTIFVTNTFSVISGGADFQTFYLDSSFMNVFRVEVLNARWSLDNLVIGGVPEPSSGTLILLGALCGLGWSRVRSKRT